jgi:pseudaminic acid synthase
LNSKRDITSGTLCIGLDHPPVVVAEMSGNHNGSLDRALRIVEAAAQAGAHAVKLQTYTADTMTLDVKGGDFQIDDPRSPWHGRNLYELYRDAHTPWEWHEPIFRRARELGMECFSTPFDASAVEFLERLNVPCFKIASFENTDLALIRRVAATGKPLILSTGLATEAELTEAVEVAREAGARELVLLKCTSAYPAEPRHSDLRTIPDLRERFDCHVGLSDHTAGVGAAIAAVAFGAVLIEKHFTLSRADGGVDAGFSLEPRELATLVTETERAWQALGTVRYGPSEAEKPSIRFRRSIYVARDLAAGDLLTHDNVRCVRPGYGLPTKHLEQILGRKVNRAVDRGTPVTWDLLA